MAERHEQKRKVVEKIKLVLVGNMDVGKTSLAVRFARSAFDENHGSTIGASFLAKAVEMSDKTIIFHIWDTAGQERFHSLIPMYLRDARAAIVLYDITDENSFKNVKNIWMPKLQKDGPENLQVAIVGSKLDLTHLRQVDKQRAEHFAQKYRCLFTETSAKTGANVEKLFYDIADSLSDTATRSHGVLRSSTIHLDDSDNEDHQVKERKKCCAEF
ncbi:ras-related protein Rab-5A-like [Gigantopelta aegis]|uniref:ras-related protein Rab-5A-like n=1 Tax=Gigantopelta aegis TaxID=1735272 RepID=UPI001B888161|nr:ras-related protein Rab-5A-like [Gigantopelta aegis]XP_041373970.1 ras-related protein Rab-5A-like [Gigantopelta aegis]